MFAVIFILALITVHIGAEIPSYIQVCSRRDPNLDQCIVNNIDNLKGRLCDGIPELGIPSGNPYTFDELLIIDGPNAKIYIRDAKVMGMCDFTIKSFYADIDRLHFEAEIVFKQIKINTTYDFNVRLLVPIAYKGLIYLILDNVGAKADIDINLTTRDNKKYIYLSKLKINIDFKNYNIKYDVDNSDLAQFYEIIKNFVGNNRQEIIKILKPVIEAEISRRIILISNNIVKQFTYEELFPDKNINHKP
ncbi:PREDICTED: uncharacterized protein LOC108687891 [Atta colombica]|uniref:uncharacterized protein LOC108687891 n=1 Tax=Atta colombica TaxID=520822 RepID=UPI00084C3121|nr:PREDICTED: uncharacterized protein LOC108687891 [Atta colombica]